MMMLLICINYNAHTQAMADATDKYALFMVDDQINREKTLSTLYPHEVLELYKKFENDRVKITYDKKDKKYQIIFDGKVSTSKRVTLNPDATLLAYEYKDDRWNYPAITLLGLLTKKRKSYHNLFDNNLEAIRFSPDGKFLGLVSPTQVSILEIDNEKNSKLKFNLFSNNAVGKLYFFDIQFDQNSTQAAVATPDKTVIFDVKNYIGKRRYIETLDSIDTRIYPLLAFSSDNGKSIITNTETFLIVDHAHADFKYSSIRDILRSLERPIDLQYIFATATPFEFLGVRKSIDEQPEEFVYLTVSTIDDPLLLPD